MVWFVKFQKKGLGMGMTQVISSHVSESTDRVVVMKEVQTILNGRGVIRLIKPLLSVKEVLNRSSNRVSCGKNI